MPKINLPNVTLFCISSDNVEGALFALQHSMKGIDFGAVKLITHEEPKELPEGIEFSKCYEITSIHDYNYYCIYNLSDHIDTEYCLLVQPDGFVINPDKWEDEFFKYDYIGPPWYGSPMHTSILGVSNIELVMEDFHSAVKNF